jgi:hypothetical protein
MSSGLPTSNSQSTIHLPYITPNPNRPRLPLILPPPKSSMPRTRTAADRDAVREEFVEQMTELLALKDNVMVADTLSDRKAAVLGLATGLVSISYLIWIPS